MHSIRDIAEKIKGYSLAHVPRLRPIPDDLFLGLIIILVAFGSFGLGRLSKIEGSKTPIRIEGAPSPSDSATTTKANTQSASIIGSQSAQLVASKNGIKYYYPWCTGVKNISPANIIYFATKADAEAKVLTPSATCKGL